MDVIEIEGATPGEDLLKATVSSYGHFTAMQVRGGKTRGIDLHLRRLEAANRERFGVGLDPDRVLALIRHALGESGTPRCGPPLRGAAEADHDGDRQAAG